MAKKPNHDTAADDAAHTTAPSAPERDAVHLVAMTKDGATLDVHPSCVAAHERVGWVRVQG